MLKITPISPALGAQIDAIDLAKSLDADTQNALRDAFHEHVVLLFRKQRLTPAQQVALTEAFGPVQPHPLATRRHVDNLPGVLILENKPGTPGARNDYWHSDISHSAQPPLGTMLYALEVPQGRGDTMFCNMYTAYETLSEGLKRTLRGMHAVHSPMATLKRNNDEHNDGLPITALPPSHTHPVIRTHPATNRRTLYVNPHFTTHFSDMTEEESAPLLNHLYSSATRAENVYRHRWEPGDVLLWDNRCTMHYAVRDYGEHDRRLMHRTTAAGDAPR